MTAPRPKLLLSALAPLALVLPAVGIVATLASSALAYQAHHRPLHRHLLHVDPRGVYDVAPLPQVPESNIPYYGNAPIDHEDF